MTATWRPFGGLNLAIATSRGVTCSVGIEQQALGDHCSAWLGKLALQPLLLAEKGEGGRRSISPAEPGANRELQTSNCLIQSVQGGSAGSAAVDRQSTSAADAPNRGCSGGHMIKDLVVVRWMVNRDMDLRP